VPAPRSPTGTTKKACPTRPPTSSYGAFAAGCAASWGTAPRRQAHPLTVTELEQLVSTIDPGTAIGARDRAVILLGYASALRPGELSALDLVATRFVPATPPPPPSTAPRSTGSPPRPATATSAPC